MSPADENNHPGEIEITNDLTIPKLFLKNAEKFGKQRVAMREKEFG
jgi:long-chain acyl-CoA synthetase